MIGGVVTSAILELLIYPVIFVIWRRRSLPKDARDEHPEAIADERAPSTDRPRRSFARFLVTALAIAALGMADTTAGRSSAAGSLAVPKVPALRSPRRRSAD
jgi:hypothetical protein